MNNMCGKPNMNTNFYDSQNYGYQPANNMSYTPNTSTTNSSGMTGQMINQWPNNANNQWHNQETVDKINQLQNSTQTISLTPETLSNTDFLPAYLTKHIGKWIRAEFLIGGFLEQRVGILYEVGASYIIIKSIEPDTLVACDLFSIRFVTIVLNNDFPKLMSF